MKQRYKFALGLTLLLILTGLVIWQGSFTVGDYGPASLQQTYVFWGLSTLIFLLTVLLAFMLFRDAVKLYVARRAGVEGSRIRTKIVIGALTLTFLPMLFLVLWSVEVLNRNLDKWFSRPGERVTFSLVDVAKSLEGESRRHADALARWVADSAELRGYLDTGHPPNEFLLNVCAATAIEEAHVVRPDGGHLAICDDPPPATPRSEAPSKARQVGMEIAGRAPIAGEGGEVVVRIRMPLDLDQVRHEIETQVRDYNSLALTKRETRRFYLQLLLLITLFILFIATWVALFLARQITSPLTAVLEAARAVRSGNLAHRVHVAATDELATLVRAFNEMTQDLETNRDELERRRRFIEAVIESIPTGVISLAHDGAIQLTNSVLRQIFPEEMLRTAARLNDLLTPDQQAEFARLLRRARRRGSAVGQVELTHGAAPRQFSVTVSALDARVTSGFVVLLEDTTEQLRAQKAAAWHEVARRIAHELKNPLTPIGLSSERILRQLDRCNPPAEVRRIIHECCATIGREVQSVKSLVDEFARFARFPAAQPVPSDLNAVVRDALAVFEGRLDDVKLHLSLATGLPPVALDHEQFKRVIVNLVENAAEAMRDAPLRELLVETSTAASESVELIIADTGCGISTGDKAKLFLPDFSTKNRGTGLGLAIVSHIVSEHHAQIRVEDNLPAGARFIIELPVAMPAESDARVLSHS